MNEDRYDFYERHDEKMSRCDCRLSGDTSDASDCDLHGLNALPFPDAGDIHSEPEKCPVRLHVFARARTVGEMMDALNCHRLEYCEECGQLVGFFKRRRAA